MNDDLKLPKGGEDARRPRRMTRRQWRETQAVLRKMGEIASTILPNVRWTDTPPTNMAGINLAPEAP